MMRMFVIVTAVVMTVNGQEIGTGLPFLKNGSDARSAGMGETGTALSGDHSSFSYNPASLRSTKQRQLVLSHRVGFADVTSDHIGATLPGEQWTIGLMAVTSSVGGIEVRQRPGEAEGTFSARNAALGVGASYAINDELTVGVTGKLLYEKIYIDEASGYAADAGIHYKVNDEFTAGASVVNLGSMSALRSASSELPSSLRFGGAYHTALTSEITILGAVDMVKTLDDNGTHLHAGFETVYDSMLMLRGGYQSGYETRSFSAGLGVRYEMLRLDYSVVPNSGAFMPNHTVSIMFFL